LRRLVDSASVNEYLARLWPCDERWKLVYVPTRSGVRYVLFDLESDPHETTDVSAEHADTVTKMKAELWKWMLEDPLMEQKDGWLVPRGAAK
jgi:hypothetical protein